MATSVPISVAPGLEEVVRQIKEAINAFQREAAAEGKGIEIKAVDLSLEAVALRDAGGQLKFTVPFVGLEVEIGGKLAKEQTQTINLTLFPTKQVEEFSPPEIGPELLEGMRVIREAVRYAAEGEPRFDLREPKVELSFVVTKEGKVTLFVAGEMKDTITHKAKLTLTGLR
jgi:hypothetical protein